MACRFLPAISFLLALARPAGAQLAVVAGADPAAREFPIFDTFASFQRRVLQELFTPDRLARLANSEFRAASPQRPEDSIGMALGLISRTRG